MDYIILRKLANGEFKPLTFSDGVIPIYNKEEAVSDMREGDALFRVEEVKK
mgnify:CR=1 FL=1